MVVETGIKLSSSCRIKWFYCKGYLTPNSRPAGWWDWLETSKYRIWPPFLSTFCWSSSSAPPPPASSWQTWSSLVLKKINISKHWTRSLTVVMDGLGDVFRIVKGIINLNRPTKFPRQKLKTKNKKCFMIWLMLKIYEPCLTQFSSLILYKYLVTCKTILFAVWMQNSLQS